MIYANIHLVGLHKFNTQNLHTSVHFIAILLRTNKKRVILFQDCASVILTTAVVGSSPAEYLCLTHHDPATLHSDFPVRRLNKWNQNYP